MDTAGRKPQVKKVTLSLVTQRVCNFYVFLYLFLMAAWFPFFLTFGYRNAGTDKAMLFRFLGLSLLLSVTPCALISGIAKWRKEGTKEFFTKVPDSDWLVLGYLLVTVLSFLLSDNKEEAFFGAKGWYIGFVTQMIYLMSYFFISRFLRGEKILLVAFAVSTAVSFTLGILNRFSLYPLKLEGANPSFIATLGNINWFCGYWSVFFPMAVGLFYQAILKKGMAGRVLSGLYLALATMAGAVQGSDSAMLVFVTVIVVLFCMSCGDIPHRKAFYATLCLLCGACQVLRVVRMLFPEAMNYDCRTTELLTGGNVTLFLFFTAFLLWGIFHRREQNEIGRNRDTNGFLRRERSIVLVLLAVGVLSFLLLLVRNTRQPGSIGSLSDNPAFTFQEKWGSSRGVTWTAGLRVFEDMPFGKKLIGLGPDSFAYGVYKEGSSAKEMVVANFGNSRLTNAHNEWITVLVNTGILGFLFYLGFFFAKTIRFIKSYLAGRSHSALVLACGLALAGYMSHNLFSFQQALNGPLVFIMMGVGEALLENKAEISL